MSKLILLHTSHHLTPIHRRVLNAAVLTPLSKPLLTPFSLSGLRLQCLRSSFSPPLSLRSLSARAFDSSSSSSSSTKEEELKQIDGESGPQGKVNSESVNTGTPDKDYPTGEFQFQKMSSWKSFVVKLRMLIALPWERVKKGSVLTMKLRGQVFFFPFLLCQCVWQFGIGPFTFLVYLFYYWFRYLIS